MKTWIRTACGVLALGLISISVGCQDAPKPMTGGAEKAPGTAAPGAPALNDKAESGSGLKGGVDVPPPVQPDSAEKPAETKPEAEKPAEEKPAEEKPAEEKKAE